MKVLFISHEATRSGAPIALLSLLKDLRVNCHDVQVDILLLSSGALVDEFYKLGHIICQWKFKKRLINKVAGRIFPFDRDKALIKSLSNDYDVIYANTIASLRLACIIKKALSIPLIFQCHESEYLLKLLGADPSQFGMCDDIITVSRLSADVLHDEFHVSTDRIHIVPPSSSIVNNSTGGVSLVKNGTDFFVGIVGNADWVKGVDLFPLVVKRMYFLHPDFRGKFVWIGGFDKMEELRLQHDINRMGIADKIVLTGEIKEPYNYYQLFDIGLVLSREESFSLSTLEMASLGKPIVAFEKALGVGDMLEQDEAIMLAKYLDIDDICEKIYLLYSDNNLRCIMGTRAKDVTVKFSNLANSHNRIIQLIESYCKN